MYDTSDRTVTSYICPSTPDHSFGFYYIYNKESTTSPVHTWLFYSILWNIMRTLISIMSDRPGVNYNCNCNSITNYS